MAVSVEQLRVSEEWQPGKPVEDPYRVYKACEGTLDEELFNAVMRSALTIKVKILTDADKAEAKILASRGGIPLTATLLTFYGILRDGSFSVPPGKEKDFIELTGTDQKTFAQALLLDHQPEAYRRFVSANPVAFPQNHAQASPEPAQAHTVFRLT